MTEPEFTITIHIRKPDRPHDPAFHMTLQCPHCCAAWFKPVDLSMSGLPVECVNCGTVMDAARLFRIVDQAEIHFDD